MVTAVDLPCVRAAGPAHAERVGEFAGSGFLFKDNIEVVALEDPGGECEGRGAR
jgi:catabolite regulation protein CreA